MCNFDPKNWTFGAKVNFLYGNRDYCQQSRSPVYPGLQLSHSDYSEKISASELWVIFLCSPLFLTVLGLCHFISKVPFILDSFLTKLGRTINKMTDNDNGTGPGPNFGEATIFTFGRKARFGQKCV